MKSSILLFITLLLLTSCTTPKPKTAPAWYTNISSDIQYEIIGYGEGKTLKEAKSNAKEDIAQIVLTTIESSFTDTIVEKNDGIEIESKSFVDVQTKLNLYNIRRVKTEQKEGIFYVALKYINLDLSHRVKKTVTKFQCLQEETSYLHHTPLLKNLSSELECILDFKLQRMNDSWYLKYSEHLFVLSEYEFEKLFVTKKSDIFNLKISKSPLIDGDKFHFDISTKKEGYITLLNLYENGIVTVLEQSKKIEKKVQIPSEEYPVVFEAGLIDNQRDSYELFIAILSDTPLDMSRFVSSSQEYTSSKRAYNFDELIEFLKDYEYATLFVTTLLS
ncbi:MAG: LPP20 family lipoprotein [Campylobacterota bacterium]|nr:LPP20 family lipoprotein [Campylobacterota bacterium]